MNIIKLLGVTALKLILVFICANSSNCLPTNSSSSYSLQYDDSIYVEYNDTLEPDPECSVIPTCQQSTGQWGDESLEDDVVVSAKTGCQTHVNCYEYIEFPPRIPIQVTALTIQGSFFENLTALNMIDLADLMEVVMEFNELRHIDPGAFQNQAKVEVNIKTC